MKEYTFLSLISVIGVIWLDFKLKIYLLKRVEFYIYLLAIIFFMFLVNGYLTAKNIVIYGSDFFQQFRIGSIPLEDFGFGFAMVTLTIIFWEFFKKKIK